MGAAATVGTPSFLVVAWLAGNRTWPSQVCIADDLQQFSISARTRRKAGGRVRPNFQFMVHEIGANWSMGGDVSRGTATLQRVDEAATVHKRHHKLVDHFLIDLRPDTL